MAHKKLFIPGPVEVDEGVLKTMSTPMIGHRMKDFADLYAEVRTRLQQVFGTTRPTLVSTSSATGIRTQNSTGTSMLRSGPEPCAVGANSPRRTPPGVLTAKVVSPPFGRIGGPMRPTRTAASR